MRSRLLVVAALLLAAGLVGCRGSPTADQSGRLSVRRVTKPEQPLLDAPAIARYCVTDSTLSVIAVGRTWTGGIAIRAPLPLERPRTFPVGRLLDTLGLATAAFRPIGGVARLGVSGSVRLGAGTVLDGTFDISVTDSAGPNLLFRGSFSRVRYRTASGGACAL